MTVRTGLEVLLDDPHPIAGKRIGLVTNQSAVTGDLRHAVRLLHAGRGGRSSLLPTRPRWSCFEPGIDTLSQVNLPGVDEKPLY